MNKRIIIPPILVAATAAVVLPIVRLTQRKSQGLNACVSRSNNEKNGTNKRRQHVLVRLRNLM